MTIAIIIECETNIELYNHLDHLKNVLKHEFRKHGTEEKDFTVSDNNCYGRHDCSVSYKDLESFDISRNENSG